MHCVHVAIVIDTMLCSIDVNVAADTQRQAGTTVRLCQYACKDRLGAKPALILAGCET